MDNLTHTLTGLALSRAGLNRWCPHATAILLLAVNVADIDIVSLAGGQTAYLQWHRHITHAFAAVPVMALVAWLIVRLVWGPSGWKGYALACLGALTHPLLDMTNVYGVRALLPFSGEWLRLDSVNVVDFWIWAILLLAVVGPFFSRLVSSEIGARASSGRGFAVFALLLLGGYEYGRFVLHQRAEAVLDARLYGGAVPRSVAALPGPVNPLKWRGLVETRGFYVLVDLDLVRDFDPSAGAMYYKPELEGRDAEARVRAGETRAFQVFSDFSRYPFWRVSPEGPQDMRVEAMDLRFGTPGQGKFMATAILGPRLEVNRAWFQF